MKPTLISLLMIHLAAGCGGTEKSEPSGPITPASGQTWWADLDGLELVDPAEAEGLLALVTPDYPLLLSATNVTDSDFAFLFALANPDRTQDHCSRTITMDGTRLATDGSFEFGPEDFTLANGAMTEDLHMTGQFSADLSRIHSITMKGTIQLNSIPEDLLPLGGVDVCELLGTVDIFCGPCRDGTDRCLAMHMVGVTGSLEEGVHLEDIAEANSFDDCITDTGMADE